MRHVSYCTVLLACIWAFASTSVSAASIAGVNSYAATYPALSDEQLLRQVVKGDELAQHELGNRLALGRGDFPSNSSAAAMWYSRAARRGIPGSASLSSLPNAPIRIDRTRVATVDEKPTANIAENADSPSSLLRNIDGSLSSDDEGIVNYIWDVWSADSPNAIALISDLVDGQAQVTLPAYGIWYVTLIVMDASGQIDYKTQRHEVSEPLPPPSAPSLITPLAGTQVQIGQTIAFHWTQSDSAASYQLQVIDSQSLLADGISGFVSDDNCVAGVCSLEIAIDVAAASTYQWQVRATSGSGNSDFVSNAFSVIATATERPYDVINSFPENYAQFVIGEYVTFEWQHDDLATSYDFFFYDSSNGTNRPTIAGLLAHEICVGDTCSLTTEVDVGLALYHMWRVRGLNSLGPSRGPVYWSKTIFSTIEPHTEAPASISLLSPASGASLTQGFSTAFSWQRSDRATSYEINLPTGSLSGNASVSIPLTSYSSCTADTCSFSTLLDLPIGDDYSWHVKAINSVGSTETEELLFSVVPESNEPPVAPVLSSPVADRELFVDSSVQFVWEAVADATSYEFYITDSVNGALPVQANLQPASLCTSGLCSLTVLLDIPLSTSHSWHVRAIRNAFESTWSERTFAVIEEVIEPPTAPVLISPVASAEFLPDASVQFSWQEVFDASSYDFYITDSINGALPVQAGLLPAAVCVSSVCTVELAFNLPVSDEHTWHVRANRDDLSSSWTQRYIGVLSLISDPPIAQITMAGYGDSAVGAGPLTINFDPRESTDDVAIESYVWNFGDGSALVETDSNDIQTHTYSNVGTYTAKLTVSDADELTHENTVEITVFAAAPIASAKAASRLLAQASFGPSAAGLAEVQSLGIENWIDRQLSLKGDDHLDYVQVFSNGSGRGPRHEIWWADAIDGEDQLRQRMAFALSQIFVVSDTGFTLSNAQYPVTHYYDILRNHAFGNFRELLEEVTLSPVMGLYLSMLQNAKGDEAGLTRADENFAREILQLFTIGLHQLNLDGSVILDGAVDGIEKPIPSFTQDQIEAFARVFTGWNYADAGRWDRAIYTSADMISPMLPFEEYHDTDSKTLLNGVVAPAGNNARQDLELALDNIFNHQNVGPFISKQLIKRFVTSNPTPGYIERVATVFNDNGVGVRGDLGAVMRTLLLDEEARTIPSSINYYGKLREPVLRFSHVWRAFNVQRGTSSNILRNELNTVSPYLDNFEAVTGQAVLRSPSVFNFFQPSYSPAGPIAEANLDAPEFELFTESNELATTNRLGRQIQELYSLDPETSQQTISYLDFSTEVALADDVPALLEHLDVLLLSGNMSDTLENILTNHLTSDEMAGNLSARVRDAVMLIMASPDYLVQM